MKAKRSSPRRRTARPLAMWAVIVQSSRSEWIHWMTLASTKKESWRRFLEQWLPEHHAAREEERRQGKLSIRLVRCELL